jgi:hypothetical protein
MFPDYEDYEDYPGSHTGLFPSRILDPEAEKAPESVSRSPTLN